MKVRSLVVIQINARVERSNHTFGFAGEFMMLARYILTGLISILPLTAFAQEFGVLVPDTPTRAGDVEAVCTGVSLEARENPAWNAYPLKIEVAGRGGQYLGDVRLVLSQKSKTFATLTCGGPWILFRIPAGRYQVQAETEGKTVSSATMVPAMGQGRVILRLLELGGTLSPAPTENGKSPSPTVAQ